MKLRLFVTLLASLVAAGLWYGWKTWHDQRPYRESIQVFCAAGLKDPVTLIARNFTEETGIDVQLQFGGTGTLLSQMEISGKGDLFVAADQGSVDDARKRGLIRESVPLLKQHPVIAVAKGNPKHIRSLEDLFRPDVRVAAANPEAASIGKACRKAFGARWEEFLGKVAVLKPTVTEIAADVSLGAVDAALVWNSLTGSFREIEAVEDPALQPFGETASVCVVERSMKTAPALQFARYLAAPEKGGGTFSRHGFEPVPGDAWSPRPELLLYSGAVNRIVMEDLVREFSTREGLEITTVYNGCGILCAAMQTMAEAPENQLPDMYFACDVCFVPPVADLFPEAVFLTETPIVIAIPKDPAFPVTTLADLAQPGLRLGICNAEQSTLGFMTQGILHGNPMEQAIRKNIAVEVPTADFLINQLLAGGLDAAIVYEVNARLRKDNPTVVPILHEGARAVQPFAVRAGSPHYQAGKRLLDFLVSQRKRFEDAGFAWHEDLAPKISKDIVIPDWLKPAARQP